MGRPRIETALRKTIYKYDYPDQRLIASYLTAQDIKVIVAKTNYSSDNVYAWCDGKRRNARIEFLARILSEANKEKLEMVEKLTMNN